MAPWIYLAVSLVGAAFAASGLLRGRRLNVLVVPYFFAGWLTSELAVHHVAWQAAATVGFAAFGALSAWPGVLGLAITFASWAALLVAWQRSEQSASALGAALAERSIASGGALPPRLRLNPFKLKTAHAEYIRDVPYGEPLEGDKGRRNLLDVVRPREAGEGRPILLQVHGGGWMIGEKEQQGQPLMAHLAERGWVSFAINYRLAPRAPLPAHIVDCKRAIAWIREHAHEYGADPDFICVTGGSAGGHLSALTALTANDAAFQPGFEQADTSIAAAVPMYGVYDLLDRHGHRGDMSMVGFLERMVVKRSPDTEREFWESLCPVSRVHADAPPFFVIHGTHDSLSFVEDARSFVEALRAKSRNPVLYAEVEGAQHAFDVFHSPRCAHTVHAIAAFLEAQHAAYLESRSHG